MTGERCGTCRFWLRDNRDKEDEQPIEQFGAFGHCRRSPPKLISPLVKVAMGKPRLGDQHDMDEIFGVTDTYDATAFPGTYHTEWCGEFRPAAPSAEVVIAWEAALRQYDEASAAVVREGEGDEDVSSATVDVATAALHALIEAPAPDHPALARKLHIVDAEGYHEHPLTWRALLADAARLGGEDRQ